MSKGAGDDETRAKRAMVPPLLVRHGSGFGPGPGAPYFDRIEPTEGTGRATLLFVHGGAHTGSCWLRTAAGAPGWAYRLAERAYPCVVIDWPGHGRSGALDEEKISGEYLCHALAELVTSLDERVVLVTHSMGGALGWRVAELASDCVAGIVAVAPGPPGNIQEVPELLEERPGSVTVQSVTGPRSIALSGFTAMSPARGRTKLIGNSTQFPVELETHYFATLNRYASRLVYERSNVRGSQVRVEDPRKLSDMPVLVVTGEADTDHPREVDGAIVEWLSGVGARAEHLLLADVGIRDNGHMLMMENNADEIVGRIADWLDRAVPAEAQRAR